MKKWVLCLGLMIQTVLLSALDIQVRIFSEFNIDETEISCMSGRYQVVIDGQLNRLMQPKESLIVKYENGSLSVICATQEIFYGNSVVLKAYGIEGRLMIKPLDNGPKERIYDGSLTISEYQGFLKLINSVDLEKYVAGVIQSEALGSSKDLEFFKIQAIISRTYIIANMNKHAEEGFHVCDAVHCQVYKSRCSSPLIWQAVSETFDKVIVDNQQQIILATFYSNSGGETANSEDVWSIPIPYLKSVVDTFSLSCKNAFWEKHIAKEDWLNYFVRKYGPEYKESPLVDTLLNYRQPVRCKYMMAQIPLKNVRTAFRLRSTLFNVVASQTADEVIIYGRGYGHGVGLSQEGAANMVRQGYSCEDVLKFYYTGVQIAKYTDLLNF